VDGLRERKKRETRQRISDMATALFMERGFDTVTVSDIAAAADVSKVTVFNYFPRKEQMFFDRDEQALELLSSAVRGRPAGASIPSALRRLVLDLAGQRHPLSGLRDGTQRFHEVVAESVALQAAARELLERVERELIELIAEDVGAPPEAPEPRMLGALVLTTYRVAYLYAVDRLRAGEQASDIYPAYVAAVNSGFDAIEHLPVGDPSFVVGASPSRSKPSGASWSGPGISSGA
jgi:AcrR family transcriptional regulator